MWKKENINLFCYRGDTQYYHCGVRIKPGSPASRVSGDYITAPVCQKPSTRKRKLSGSSDDGSGKIIKQEENTNHSSPQVCDHTSSKFRDVTDNCNLNTGFA
jgi:hypothetical protein